MLFSSHLVNPHLLSIDHGLRFGWALFNQEGDLSAYGSQKCGKPRQLKRLAQQCVDNLPKGSLLVVEGGGPLCTYWSKAAHRSSISFEQVAAEEWRFSLCPERVQRTSSELKQWAIIEASRQLRLLKAQRIKALRHDTAEAILVGMWALQKFEWCLPKSQLIEVEMDREKNKLDTVNDLSNDQDWWS